MILSNTKGVKQQFFSDSKLPDWEKTPSTLEKKYELDDLFEKLPDFDAPLIRFSPVKNFDPKNMAYNTCDKENENWNVVSNAIVHHKQR